MASKVREQLRIIPSPGFDGLPFRGLTIPDLVKDGPQPVEVLDAKVRVFDLSDTKQLAEYEAICDKVAKGLFLMSREEMEWVPENKNWMVMIRFLPRYAEEAGKHLNRLKFDSERGYVT